MKLWNMMVRAIRIVIIDAIKTVCIGLEIGKKKNNQDHLYYSIDKIG